MLSEIKKYDSLIKLNNADVESLQKRIKALHTDRNFLHIPAENRRQIINLEEALNERQIAIDSIKFQRNLLAKNLKRQRKL